MNQFKREPLRSGEADKLLAACATDFQRATVGVLLETGIRLAELCAIEEAAVNWDEKRLRVFGKGGKFRIVPLSDKATDALRLWLSVPKGASVTRLRARVQNAVKQAGRAAGIAKPVSPHICRHSWAVACIRKGIGLRSLQLMLGHSSLNVTAGYLNMSPDEVCEEFREKWNG